MRKEPIIAIILGSIVGLSVAFFAWRASTRTSPTGTTSVSENSETSSPENTERPTPAFGSFAIVNPENNSIVEEDEVVAEGFTTTNKYVGYISSESSDLIKADSNEFEFELSLNGGLNNIIFWEFDETQTKEEVLSLIFTTQLENQGESNAGSLIGTVTDVSEDTFQIRTSTGQIEQLTVNAETTTYANIVGDSEEIEFSDIAIGDYIVAMGFKNGQEILEAQRVLVTTETSITDRKGLYGTVQTLSSSEFILLNRDGQEYSIDATGSVDVTIEDENGLFSSARLSQSADEGSTLIIIGRLNEDSELEAERIHILKTTTEAEE